MLNFVTHLEALSRNYRRLPHPFAWLLAKGGNSRNRIDNKVKVPTPVAKAATKRGATPQLGRDRERLSHGLFGQERPATQAREIPATALDGVSTLV